MKRLVAASLITLFATLGLSAVASAQPSTMTIEFTAPPGPPPTERVVIFVDQVACAEARFDSNPTPSVLLGISEQPPDCRVEGAEVTFLQFRAAFDVPDSPISAHELFDRTVFATGTKFEFINWAPPPAQDPGPADTLPLYMRAFVNAEAGLDPPLPGADQLPPMTIELVDPQSAAPIERLILFVAGQPCLSISFDPAPPDRIYLGAAGQPRGCADQGAAVTALQIRTPTQALELSNQTLLQPGGTYRWVNWAPTPPGSRLPGYMQTFVDVGATPQPAASGNAGPDDSDRVPSAALMLLATALLLGAGRHLTEEHPD